MPVRVTKQWVTRDEKQGGAVFKAVRVTELRRMPVNEPDPELPQAPKGWQSSDRVDSRERLMGLCQKGTEEPMLQEAGYDQRWLPYSVPVLPTAAMAAWTLDNGNGWLPAVPA